MRLIKPSFEIIEQKPGIDGLLQHIERCGRTCYKSEDKITEDSAEKFVNMLVNRGHTAMVEHGTVYLTLGMPDRWAYFKYCTNKYSEAISEGEAEKGTWVGYVTTNYRVLLQNDWLDDLQYLTEPTKHIRKVTVKFVCDRGVSHEFVRHKIILCVA
jgi:thymidylate synthase (FAD)